MLPGWISAVLLISFGLLLALYGYALWRIALVVGGFAIGFLMGAQIAPPDQQVLAIVAGVVLAVVFGMLSYFAYSIVSVLIGVVMGGLAGLWIASLLGVTVAGVTGLDGGTIALVVIGAVVGVALGIALRDLIIVLLTAVAGGGAVVMGVQTLAPLINPAWVPALTGILPFLIWVALAVIGIIMQYILFRRRLTGNLIPG